MKIVILDGHAINPGDLSWDALRRLGSFRCFAEGLAVTPLSRVEHTIAESVVMS